MFFLHIELLKSVENIGILTNLYNQKGIPGVIFPHAHYFSFSFQAQNQ